MAPYVPDACVELLCGALACYCSVCAGAVAVLCVGWMLWKAPKVLKWWFGLLTAPLVLGLAFVVEVLRGWGLWWAAPTDALAQQAAAVAAAVAATQRAAEAAGAAPPSPESQVQPPASPAQDQQQERSNGVHHGLEQQNGAAAGAAGSPARAAASGRSRSSSRRKGGKRGQLLPDGPWWPRSFGPVDLAATCYWWTSLLGWHLASW